MPGAPGPELDALISARRTAAMQLRIAGLDNLAIGKALAADPRINSRREPYPAGYGRDRYEAGDDPIDDHSLVARVAEDITRAIKLRKTQMASGAEEMRSIQDARLEALLAAWMPKALNGNEAALYRVVRLLERQARLHGLDTPRVGELIDGDGETVMLVPVERQRDAATSFLDQLSAQEEAAIARARALTEAAAPPPAP